MTGLCLKQGPQPLARPSAQQAGALGLNPVAGLEKKICGSTNPALPTSKLGVVYSHHSAGKKTKALKGTQHGGRGRRRSSLRQE